MPKSPPTFRPRGVPSATERKRAYEADRYALQPWRRLYGTQRWKDLRASQLAAEPLCRRCADAGKVEVATVCDHVERHYGDVDMFWSGPFQSLCASCHSSDKQR